MKPLFGHDAAVCQFVMDVAGMSDFDPCSTIGVIDREGRLVAGLVYHNWDRDSEIIEISGAAIDRRWLTREVHQLMYDYPFVQLKCQMIFKRTSARNEHINKQLRRWGYNEYRLPRMRGRDEDGILFTFTCEQWAVHPRNLINMKEAA